MRIPVVGPVAGVAGERAGRKDDQDEAPFTAVLAANDAQGAPHSDIAVAALSQEMTALRAQLAAAQRKICELERLADEDPLLPLLNRRGFMRELTRASAYVERYDARAGLAYVDVNAFKQINDRHGHAAGDQVLRLVADVLAQNTRRSDTVGRIGGDEFGLILWSADTETARAKADHLEAAIARIAPPQGVQAISASIGVTVLQAGEPADAALARADADMYARKTAGKTERA